MSLLAILLTSHLTIRLEKVECIVILDEVMQMPNERGSYGGIVKRGLKEEWSGYLRTEYEFSMAICRSLGYDVEPMQHYPRILRLGAHLRSLLSSIPPKQQKDVQARLIFEIQTAFMVECTDLLIDELIHRRGRIQQSMNASRQKVENDFRTDSLESIRAELKEMAIGPLNFADIRLVIPA